MTDQIKAARFVYHGKSRIVDNIDEDENIIAGFEMRSSGQFSYQVKRFRKDKIEGEIEYIDPPKREGPVIGR